MAEPPFDGNTIHINSIRVARDAMANNTPKADLLTHADECEADGRHGEADIYRRAARMLV